MSTTWDAPNALDAKGPFTTSTILPNPNQLGTYYDVSSWDFLIFQLTANAAQGTTSGVSFFPIFFDESGLFINEVGAGTSYGGLMLCYGKPSPPIAIYAQRCLGPKLQIEVLAAGVAPSASVTVWGSNRRFRFDGPYSPSVEGGLIVSAGLAVAANGSTSANLPPYAGPAVLYQRSVSSGAAASIVTATDGAGNTHEIGSNTGPPSGSLVGITPPVPLWIPPLPCVVTAFSTPAQTVEVTIIAA